MPSLPQLLHDARHRRAWRWLWLLLLAGVTVAALTPGEQAPSLGASDKLDHLLAFGTLALTGGLSAAPGRRAAAILAVLLLTYGVGIELAQTLVPGRLGDGADVVADAVGIALGLALLFALRRGLRKMNS